MLWILVWKCTYWSCDIDLWPFNLKPGHFYRISQDHSLYQLTKFEHFGLIQFWVLRTNKQTDCLERPTHADRHSLTAALSHRKVFKVVHGLEKVGQHWLTILRCIWEFYIALCGRSCIDWSTDWMIVWLIDWLIDWWFNWSNHNAGRFCTTWRTRSCPANWKQLSRRSTTSPKFTIRFWTPSPCPQTSPRPLTRDLTFISCRTRSWPLCTTPWSETTLVCRKISPVSSRIFLHLRQVIPCRGCHYF